MPFWKSIQIYGHSFCRNPPRPIHGYSFVRAKISPTVHCTVFLYQSKESVTLWTSLKLMRRVREDDLLCLPASWRALRKKQIHSSLVKWIDSTVWLKVPDFRTKNRLPESCSTPWSIPSGSRQTIQRLCGMLLTVILQQITKGFSNYILFFMPNVLSKPSISKSQLPE